MEAQKVDLNDPNIAASVVALLNEYAMDLAGGNEPLSAYTQEHLIDELMKRPTCHVFILRQDCTPVGLAICFEGFSTFKCKPLLNIHDFMISAPHRGKGFSKVLLSEIERFAKSIDCCKVTLEVLEGNTAAVGAYKSFGFNGYQLDPVFGKAHFWQKFL